MKIANKMNSVKKILIVEDEISLLNALCDTLADEGFTILRANNGRDGLKIALSEHPDLILLDIELPVMDGITMLKKIRADAHEKQAKVIIFTNSSSTQNVADAISLGSHDFLVKSNWKIEDIVKLTRDNLQ